MYTYVSVCVCVRLLVRVPGRTNHCECDRWGSCWVVCLFLAVAHFVNTPEVASERLLQLSQQRSEDLLLLRHLISRHDLSKADRKSIVNHLEQRETERSGFFSFACFSMSGSRPVDRMGIPLFVGLL